MWVPRTSTVAKARLVLTARASFLSRCSVRAEFTKPVLGCNTMVCADARRDLSFSCLVAGPWGSAVVLPPPVHWDHPQACALKVPLEPMSLPWWGGGWGGGSRCGCHEITHLGGRAIPSAWRGRDRHRGAEAASRFFPSGITQQRHSASVVVQASSTSVPVAELLLPSRPLRMSPHGQPQSSAWVCPPNPTFQHTVLVCIGGYPLRLCGQCRGQ